MISFSTTVPAIGARMMPSMRADRPARLDVLDASADGPAATTRACSAASRSASALAASVSACCRLALRDAVVLDEILVQVGQPAVGPRGGERLAVGADGRREVGRIHRRPADLPCLDLSPGETSSRVTGPENGASTLVAWSLSKSTTPVVSIDLAKRDRRDGVQADVLPLRRRQRQALLPRRGCGLRASCRLGANSRCSDHAGDGDQHGARRRDIPDSASWMLRCRYLSWRSSARSARCHQPPPSAWNNAAVSAKRLACACTRLIRAC